MHEAENWQEEFIMVDNYTIARITEGPLREILSWSTLFKLTSLQWHDIEIISLACIYELHGKNVFYKREKHVKHVKNLLFIIFIDIFYIYWYIFFSIIYIIKNYREWIILLYISEYTFSLIESLSRDEYWTKVSEVIKKRIKKIVEKNVEEIRGGGWAPHGSGAQTWCHLNAKEKGLFL